MNDKRTYRPGDPFMGKQSLEINELMKYVNFKIFILHSIWFSFQNI